MTAQALSTKAVRTSRLTSTHFSGKQRIAVAVIVVSVASFAFTLYQPGPEIDLAPHQALGDLAAAAALKLIGPGGRIILIDRETKMFKSPATQAHLKRFAQVVQKAGQIVTATNVLKVDPLRALTVPSGDFFALLRRTGETDVIVSFLGPPTLSSEQIGRLNSSHARVVAFCPGSIPRQTKLADLFQSGLVQVAIVEWEVSGSVLAEPASLHGESGHRYVAMTSSNLSFLSVGEGR